MNSALTVQNNIFLGWLATYRCRLPELIVDGLVLQMHECCCSCNQSKINIFKLGDEEVAGLEYLDTLCSWADCFC